MKGSYKVKLYKRAMITLTNPTPEAHLLSFFSKFSSPPFLLLLLLLFLSVFVFL